MATTERRGRLVKLAQEGVRQLLSGTTVVLPALPVRQQSPRSRHSRRRRKTRGVAARRRMRAGDAAARALSVASPIAPLVCRVV